MTMLGWIREQSRRQQDRDEDLSNELQAHLAHEIDDGLSRGMSQEEARAAALRKFGNRTAVKEMIHEMNSNRLSEAFLRDIRYSLRTLGKDWSFTALTVLLLALGIGGTASVFQLVYAVLIKPLPLSQPDRMVMLWSQYGKSPHVATTLDDYEDISNRLSSFEGIAAYTSLIRSLESRTGRPEMVWTSYVSSNLFSILKAQPYAGRLFSKEDDRLGGPTHIILGFGFWERHFGGDRAVIGQTVSLDHGKSATIIGIMPSDFQFPLEGMHPEGKSADVWSSFNDYPGIWEGRKEHHLNLIGRLRFGISPVAAQAGLDSLSARLEKQFQATNTSERFIVSSLQDEIVGPYRHPLQLFLASVGLVFLIACMNVVGLFVARGNTRVHEITIRSALGASKFRLAGQFLAEGFVIALVGGLAGILLALALTRLLPAMGTNTLPRISEGSVVAPIAVITLALSVSAGFLLGLIPVISSFHNTIHEGLRGTSRTATTDRTGNTIRRFLIVSQVSLAFLLSAGSLLLIRSFDSVLSVPSGFHPEHVVSVSIPVALYHDPAERVKFSEEVLRKTRELPGVLAVGMVDRLPLDGFDNKSSFYVERSAAPSTSADLRETRVRATMPGYFEAIGMPMESGRRFTDHDDATSVPVVVINETAARLLWPGGNPLGSRLKEGLPADASPWLTVVGVVGDIRQDGLAFPPVPEIFFPARQRTVFFQSLVVRSFRDPGATIAAMSDAVYSIDKSMPVTFIRKLDTFAAESAAPIRLRALLTSLFATFALALSAAGIYSVTSYTVSRSSREMGIRVALGAEPRELVKMVVMREMKLVWLGLALGLLAVPALTQLLSGLLYGVGPTDAFALSLSMLVLAVSALLAAYLPARRVMRLDPAAVLRQE